MKTIFPIEMVVKKGGSDSILKLYLSDRSYYWLMEKEPSKVIIHFGKRSFSNPTEGEWRKYHSFNNSKTISHYLNESFAYNDVLKFVAVEDKDGYLHFIYVG